jgi:hypothetical protein
LFRSERFVGLEFFEQYFDRIISRVSQGERNEIYREMGNVAFGQNEKRLFYLSVPLSKLPSEVASTDFCAFLYGEYAILLVDETQGLDCIESSKIKDMPANDKLTQVLEQTIREGNFSMFEYGHEYLLRNNRDFILPYIEHYAEQGMTAEELEKNSDIRQEYMVAIAIEARGKAEHME